MSNIYCVVLCALGEDKYHVLKKTTLNVSGCGDVFLFVVDYLDIIIFET